MVSNDTLLLLGGISAAVAVALFFLTPLLIVFLPKDYLVHSLNSRSSTASKSLWHLVKLLIRNVLACIIIFLGILMLFLPGQGLLSIIIGFLMLDAPWKKRILKNLLLSKRAPLVISKANALRSRFKKEPFNWPKDVDLKLH